MTITTVQITLPDALAQEATKARLLAPEPIERMLRERLRERLRAERIERMKAARAALTAEPLALMTPQEIRAEIEAYRTSPRELQGMEIVTAVVAVERIAAAVWNDARAGRAVERQQVAIRPAELWLHGSLDALIGVSVFVGCVHCGDTADVYQTLDNRGFSGAANAARARAAQGAPPLILMGDWCVAAQPSV